MELREALANISLIRTQMARTEVFRGYRWMTVGSTGVLALAAAGIQSIWLPDPTSNIGVYLALWVGVAVASVLICGVEMFVRAWASGSGLSRQMTLLAVEQFLPCTVVGALLTGVVATRAEEAAWMLPGLWAMLFSLGIFASYRLLPRAIFWVGVYFLCGGVACLVMARGDAALSPWTMAGTFGAGQLLNTVVLFWTQELSDDR